MAIERWEHFKYGEFACPCCGKNETSYGFIDMLNTARSLAKVPFVIESGYRCKKHNEEVGGAKRSSHMSGLAADIHCDDARYRYDVIDALLWVGCVRIIIYPNHIHADMDLTKTYPWLGLGTYK